MDRKPWRRMRAEKGYASLATRGSTITVIAIAGYAFLPAIVPAIVAARSGDAFTVIVSIVVLVICFVMLSRPRPWSAWRLPPPSTLRDAHFGGHVLDHPHRQYDRSTDKVRAKLEVRSYKVEPQSVDRFAFVREQQQFGSPRNDHFPCVFSNAQQSPDAVAAQQLDFCFCFGTTHFHLLPFRPGSRFFVTGLGHILEKAVFNPEAFLK